MADGVKNSLTENKGRKLNLKDVEVDFTKYNFIIVLNHLTIDTTNFNGCLHQDKEVVGIIPNSGNKKHLILTTLKKTGSQIATTNLEKGETRILICDENVKDIKVKSTRNFLFNQQ